MKAKKYIIITLIIIAVFLLARFYLYPGIIEPNKSLSVQTGKTTEKEILIVKEVLDGDEFLMSDGKRVRLLGVDTPEKFDSDKLDRQVELYDRDKESIKKLGVMASDYVKKLAEGKKVTLVSDPDYYDKDKYSRLLRYVYLEDGTFLNARVLQDGYANSYYDEKISKNDEFFKIELEAKKNKTGLWGEADGLK